MLDKVSAQQASISDRAVSGEGRARIGGEDEWIGFRFSTLYDPALNSAAYPEITLGGVTGDERNMPNDPMLVLQHDEERQNVVEGKSESHRVEPGGRRVHKKKNRN